MNDSKIAILLYETPLETDSQTRLSISKTFISTSSDNQPRMEVSELSLPITPHNSKQMEFSELCASPLFNERERLIRVVVDDRVLFDGVAVLRRIERSGDGGRYVLALRESAKWWRERLAAKPLADLPIECSGGWDADAVMRSWTEDTPVRFLPVTRNVDQGEISSTSIMNVTKSMSFDSYHPFLHLKSIIYKCFEQEGYSVDSIFFSSPDFAKLYMSGAYPMGSSKTLDQRMGFRARRAETTTVEADYSGSVYASPLLGGATIGNLVDIDAQGKYSDTYANGGCLSVDEHGRLVFTPKETVVASFLYTLRYQTEYVMRSRERLMGFDRVWITPSECHSFEIVNTFTDQRGLKLQPNFEYNLMVFDMQPGEIFLLRYERNGRNVSKMIYDRSTKLTLGTTADTIGQITMFGVSRDGGSTFTEYEGDWALYQGVVGERGVVDVALTLRSAPERLSPYEPKTFDQMVFDGAAEGMTLRMDAGVSISPIFFDLPIDEQVGQWRTFASLDCSQADVVEAVCKMFNLRVIEDAKRRVVRIEPADYLANIASRVDWNNKVDLSQGWTCEDIAYGMSPTIELTYQSDAIIRNWEEAACERYDAEQYRLRAAQSLPEVDVHKVPLFHPSLNDIRVCPEAPSASILVTEDNAGAEMMEHLSISPRVVRYEGLKPLQANESWGWPSYASTYPYAAFHSEQEDFTLCFCDRDDVEGLHRYHDRKARLWRSAKRVGVKVHLRSEEVMMLIETAGQEAAERNVYEFELDGERHRFTLESLDYTFGKPTAQCTFIKID